MDKPMPLNDVDLLHAALAATGEHGLRWGDVDVETKARGRDQADARLALRGPGAETIYHAEVKRTLRPAALGPVLAQMRRLPAPALLVADHVTPPLADRLRAEHVQFIDAAGNAYLDCPPVLVWVKGQRPVTRAGARHVRGRAFHAGGLQVLFALLCDPPRVDLPYRGIAALAYVAHGTVGGVLPELARLGFVGTLGGRRRLLRGSELLQQWVEIYARTLRPKLVMERWHADALDWTRAFDATRYSLLLGGEPAAQRLTRNLRPGTATFYGVAVDRQLLIDQRLRPDPEGNVEILRRFWTFEGETPGQVPDLLVYADLLAVGDARCVEIAGELRHRIVARFE